MTPLVTIGIPCFDSEQWIGQAVGSALAQTWPNREVLVIDDGSSDNSRQVVESFGESVKLFRTAHRGANFARNEILRRASGDWIQFLDADDYLLPEKLARQFEENPGNGQCDVIHSPVINEQGSRRETDRFDEQLDIFSQWISWLLPQTGGCLWRRGVIESIGGWNESMPCCQEHELYMRALMAGVRFHRAPTANAVYRIWSENTLCRRDPRRVIRVRTDLIDKLREWMKERKLWKDEHNATAARACFEMARTWAKYDLSEARAYHEGRKRQNLIQLEGPAAPITYRLAYWALGFGGAEKLARSLKR